MITVVCHINSVLMQISIIHIWISTQPSTHSTYNNTTSSLFKIFSRIKCLSGFTICRYILYLNYGSSSSAHSDSFYYYLNEYSIAAIIMFGLSWRKSHLKCGNTASAHRTNALRWLAAAWHFHNCANGVGLWIKLYLFSSAVLSAVCFSAAYDPSVFTLVFTIMEKAPTRDRQL